jgi:signal peptidase II
VKGRWLLIGLVPALAALVFAADQYTKYLVSTNLAIGQAWMPLAAFEPIVVIRHVRNSGAAFGMFPQGGLLFLLIAIVVVCAIAWYYYRRAHSAPLWVRLSLGLMLGGALGNLIDRIRFGFVVDFVDFGWWPVFNVADSSIVVGVTMLAFYMAFIQPKEVAQDEAIRAQRATISTQHSE